MSDDTKTEDVFFKAKVAGKVYTLEKLTLGQGRVMKRDFGLERMTDFDPFDADHMTGALFLCLSAEQPTKAPLELLTQIEDMDIGDFEPLTEDTATATEDDSPLGGDAAEVSDPSADSN